MTQKMIETVQNRISEMVKDASVQNIMMQFKTSEEAQEWVIKAAIATLFGAK